MPRNQELIASDDLYNTYECVTKTKVNNEYKEDCTQFKVFKDLATFKEHCTQTEYDSYVEITKIRAQDATRRTMQEDDPKKIALKQLRAKLKNMSEDDINALLETI